jgi:hypothetical protein
LAADFSSGIADAFIVAQHAQWAGDFDHARALFVTVSNAGSAAPRRPPALPSRLPAGNPAPQGIGDADQLLRAAAGHWYNGLASKIRDFQGIRALYPAPDNAVDFRPHILSAEFRHLRGTVWRMSPREFLMRAYLTSPARSETFQDLARKEARERRRETSGMDPVFPFDEGDGPRIETGGWNWLLPGNPFITVTVSDLGLIEANALWTEREPPSEFRPVEDAFVELLRPLDPS